MAPPESLIRHRDRVSRVGAATMAGARREWSKLGTGDWDIAWRSVGPRLMALMVASQVAVGREATAYIDNVVNELALNASPVATASPWGLAGTASDGRPLPSLLYEPVIASRRAGSLYGLTSAGALAFGQRMLDKIVTTQVSDASRAAVSVATVVRPKITGYRRIASLPCCPRCAVLDGRWYRWNAGFRRHPRCDCGSVPSDNSEGRGGDSGRSLFDRGQVHGLSESDAKAIADGADPAQVINAHRGMSTAGGLKTTTAGTTRRGAFGRSAGRGAVRLRPEAIYELATDRTDALAMLKRFGYIL